MSDYQYKVGDYIEYIGNVPQFYGVKGQIERIDHVGGLFFHHNGTLYALMPCEVQLIEPPVDPAYQEALARTWDMAIQEADDAGCLLYHDTLALKARNPYRSN